MTTTRERREARADRLREWAGKREAKAIAIVQGDAHYWDDLAFVTQPGHIPERARAIKRGERAGEHANKATEMAQRAANIERQAERSIYSDDTDAIERLDERIADLEAQRDRIKRYNVTCRKGSPDLSILSEIQQKGLLSCARAGQVRDNRAMPKYVLSNMSADIRRNTQRRDQLKRDDGPPIRTIVARFDSECAVCNTTIAKGATAWYQKGCGAWCMAHGHTRETE